MAGYIKKNIRQSWRATLKKISANHGGLLQQITGF
jgi:hypothetical protein